MVVGIYIKILHRGNPRGSGTGAALVEYIDPSGKSYIRTRRIQVEHETKNALALKTVNAALRLLTKSCQVTIHIDCCHIKNSYRWLGNWQKNSWHKADGKPPANAEEWKQLFLLAKIHQIKFEDYDSRHDRKLEEIQGGN